jgi:hypothetical protein
VTPLGLRAQLFLIVTLAGVAAFLFSFVALSAGLTSMAVRYPLAVACGYLTFVLLIRGWIALHRRRAAPRHDKERSFDAGDLLSLDPGVDVPVPTRLPGGSDSVFYAAGRSGGAGSGTSWGSSPPQAGSSLNVDLDVDELWPVVLAAVCALGGALAIGYVVYSAPALLAEVALDAAIMSGVYRKLNKREPSHWAMTVLRHTAIPGVILIVFAALGGYAAQRIAPEARSIGGVIRALSE